LFYFGIVLFWGLFYFGDWFFHVAESRGTERAISGVGWHKRRGGRMLGTALNTRVMVFVTTSDGHRLTFHARVDVVGQGCDVVTHKARKVKGDWSLKMQLQKRHQKGRIYMNLHSDHSALFEVIVVTKTPGKPVFRDMQCIGSDGLVSWQYCCCMHREYINCDTTWEIWDNNAEQSNLLCTLSFEGCANNEQQIAAENWLESDGTNDGSNIASNCDTFYNNQPPRAQCAELPQPVRSSLRKKVIMKKPKK